LIQLANIFLDGGIQLLSGSPLTAVIVSVSAALVSSHVSALKTV
jgi:hypothetical protein